MHLSPDSATIRGPGAVSGHVGGTLTVTCHYDIGYETYMKWWCRGQVWNLCRILIESAGTEQAVRKDWLTIKDDWSSHRFTVTMDHLSFGEADMYWCGIKRTGLDLGDLVKVRVEPGRPRCPCCVSASPCFGCSLGPSPVLICHSEGTVLGWRRGFSGCSGAPRTTCPGSQSLWDQCSLQRSELVGSQSPRVGTETRGPSTRACAVGMLDLGPASRMSVMSSWNL